MSDPQEPTRDLVGYGADLPRVEWPGGARLALNFAINCEEGSEAGPLLGDARRDARSEAEYAVDPADRDLMQEAAFEYGSRVGHWRIMRLFDEFEMTATVFAAAMALESNPPLTRAFVEHGYDFVGHGYRWQGHYGRDLDELREDVSRALRTIEELTGKPVRGWFNRPPAALTTRRVLAEAGLLFDSTTIADDLPYYADVAGRPMLVVPYALDTNDTRFWRAGLLTGEQFFHYLRDAFDCLYRESAEAPRLMSVGLHGRVQRPGRAEGLRRFLDHVRGHDDVWIAGRTEIATAWAERFAPPDAWNWGEERGS